MILGQSAGAAAALAIKHNVTVQQVDYQKLAQLLEQEGQVLAWSPTKEDDPLARMKATFGDE